MGKFIDLTGIRVGRLEVKRKYGIDTRGEVLWECQCDCGNTIIALSSNLRKANHTTSCGCYRKDNVKVINKKHGMTNTKIYNIWAAIKRRCYLETCDDYKDYGGRGITVCDEWKNDFNEFLKWANKSGYKNGLSIDRINTNGNYEPLNCRWATAKEQANNKRNNVRLTYNGETHTAKEWSSITGIKYGTLITRIRLGWTDEDVLTKKVRKRRCNA